MLNEFHSRNNRSSTCSNASKSLTASSNSIRFDQPVGHEFASNILVADLAIRSTAYKPPTPPNDNNIIKNDNTAATGKAKRRVTFNLDDIQIQTIPAYDSTLSLSSTSSSIIETEEDALSHDTINGGSSDNIMMIPNEDIKLQEEEQEEEQSEQSCQEPPPAPPISQPSTSERISKKATYDALEKRKQFRRDQQKPTIKPGYWYPLASTRTHMMRQPLPIVRSLEMTEKLINDSIQREIAMNPNLHYSPPSPSPSPTSGVEKKDMSKLNRIETTSILIADTDDEEEEIDEIPTTTTITTNTTTATTPTTTTNTITSSDEEEEEESITTTLPPSNAIIDNYKEQESDFTASVYNELAKRHNQQVVPVTEYQPPQLLFPFEQNLIPISANKDVLIISPPPSPPLEMHDDDEEPIWIDHPSLLINASKTKERRSLFFVKILNTESLDFPIDNDDTKAYSSIKYKAIESRSDKQTLDHSMQIQHELRIEDVDPNEQITITIHVSNEKNSNKKCHTNNNWYHRIRSSASSSDLERYIHENDGSICQTLFSPSRFIVDGSIDQTATLMLVNNWYRPSHELHPTPSSSSNLLLKRSTNSSWKKKRLASIIREKAVGKIYVQCLYVTVPIRCNNSSLPQTMDEAIEALNAKRFHQTDWQSGYLFQLGGNTKCLKKRYFTLTGGSLFAYPSEHQHSRNPLYKIPLSRARKLICDQIVIAESTNPDNDNTTPPTALLSQLDSMIVTQQQDSGNDDNSSEEDQSFNQECVIMNGFQLVFNNGETIQFSCETLEERCRWIAVLEVMICKLPKLPEWIIS